LPFEILDLIGLVVWILVIVVGLLAFLYPFLEGAGETSKKGKT